MFKPYKYSFVNHSNNNFFLTYQNILILKKLMFYRKNRPKPKNMQNSETKSHKTAGSHRHPPGLPGNEVREARGRDAGQVLQGRAGQHR